MAITLAEQHILATDMNFVNRLRQAMLTIAAEVLTESEPDFDLYQSRQALARQTLNNPIDTSKRIAYMLVTNSPTTNQAAINDEALLGFVRNVWTLISGYNPNAPEPPEV